MHMAVDTLGQLLAVHVTPANEQERAQMAELTRQVQQATGETVKVAFADQKGYTVKNPRSPRETRESIFRWSSWMQQMRIRCRCDPVETSERAGQSELTR